MTRDQQIADLARQLRRLALQRGLWLSGDDRLAPDGVAALTGFTRKTLNNWRSLGKGPRWCRLPGEGSRLTCKVADLAQWMTDKSSFGGSW